jgi:hypothetical protein
LVILSEENHENLRALEKGCLHWHLKKAYIDNLSVENHENLRALEEGCVYWNVMKAYY